MKTVPILHRCSGLLFFDERDFFARDGKRAGLRRWGCSRLDLIPFRGHQKWRDNAPGVSDGKKEEKSIQS
jgi:hypothetical protein